MIAKVSSHSVSVATEPTRHINVEAILRFADELREAEMPETELVNISVNLGGHLVQLDASRTELIETPA